MYFGETQIFEDRINDFVSVAKDLEIKEISEEQDGEPDNVEEDGSNQDQEEPKSVHAENNAEEPVVKREENVERTVARPRQRSEKIVANSEGRFKCDECEATFTASSSLVTHKKSKHAGETLCAFVHLTIRPVSCR